jgi:hypothetical protein
MRRLLVMASAALLLNSCDYKEVEREVGYKGRARVNPWLAAERFSERMGWETRSVISWTAPTWEESAWVLPASVISNESFGRRTEQWVTEGGHLILLVNHAEGQTSDWTVFHMKPTLEPAVFNLLERGGITLKDDGNMQADKIKFQGRTFKVDAEAESSVARNDGKPGVFVSVRHGEGRMTVLTDGRLFRNRWIGDNDNAALLDALLRADGGSGVVGFMRGSGMSLWTMLRQHLWTVMIGLAVLTVLWLWKNLSRFGPIESAAAPTVLRGYEHHLEALGDFQWRFDHATSLLAPLREQIVEIGQRTSLRAGRRDDDFFQYLADRADLPRERVFRALAEAAPADPAVLTRTTADLQQMLKVLHNPALS